MRRSDPENEADERVELWTNHRVMEWLRVVDLAEYAPNLRGSGSLMNNFLLLKTLRWTEISKIAFLKLANICGSALLACH